MSQTISEGLMFLVPLRDEGFARGVIARADPDRNILLGYFFGPRVQGDHQGGLQGDLDPAKALLRIHFGALGLSKGKWPALGKMPNWERSKWPSPDFVRRDPLNKLKPRLVRYSDDDPSRIEKEYVIDDDRGLEPDSLYGYGAVEKKLTMLLRNSSEDAGENRNG